MTVNECLTAQPKSSTLPTRLVPLSNPLPNPPPPSLSFLTHLSDRAVSRTPNSSSSSSKSSAKSTPLSSSNSSSATSNPSRPPPASNASPQSPSPPISPYGTAPLPLPALNAVSNRLSPGLKLAGLRRRCSTAAALVGTVLGPRTAARRGGQAFRCRRRRARLVQEERARLRSALEGVVEAEPSVVEERRPVLRGRTTLRHLRRERYRSAVRGRGALLP